MLRWFGRGKQRRELGTDVTAFFDETTFTASYVVCDPVSTQCAIIDSVLDYDPKSGRTSTASADRIIEFVRSNHLSVAWIFETHAHADHLSAAPYLQEKLGGKLAIGEHIKEVQVIFKGVFNLEPTFQTDGSQFDHLFKDGEGFSIGSLEGRILHTPGHTPACITYLIGDAAFVGDTLFMPDYGSARCDFPGGDAATLYASIKKIFELPAKTRIFMCHDYKAPSRNRFVWESSVEQQRAQNIHVRDGISEQKFVKMRTERDAQLDMPALILPSVQVNIRAGRLPPVEDNGVSYLKTPINHL